MDEPATHSPDGERQAAGPPPLPSRTRRPPRKPSRVERLPVTIRFGVPLAALGFLVWLLWSWWVGGTATLLVRAPAGGAVPRVVLTFFPESLSSAMPSPPPILGELVVEDRTRIRVGRDLVPERALVRVAPEGFGVGFTALWLGEEPVVFEPATAGRLEGMALSGDGPAVGARVMLLGGGSRGVPLVETVTDDRGAFVLDGFDSTLDTVTTRVLHAGHAVTDVHRWKEQQGELVVELVPTQPIFGRVLLPDSLAPDELLVLARSVPGAHAPVGVDGTFELDHVPPEVHPRLVVFGLPPEWTHGPVEAQTGQKGVTIEIMPATTVSGFVLDDRTGSPIPSASVFHRAGPSGVTGTKCNEDGSFRLGGVPPGPLTLTAQVPIPGANRNERQFRVGVRRLSVPQGEALTSIVIRVP